MNKQDFLNHSNEYLNEMLSSLLEKAYDAGYEQCAKELQKEEKNNVTWVDLGLPSGKLWGYQNIPSHKCVDVNSIPSKEDFEELYWNTRLCLNDFYIGETRYWGCYFIGRTGATLCLRVWEQYAKPEINLWIYAGEVKDGIITNAPHIWKRADGSFYVSDNTRLSPECLTGINLYVS